MFDKILWRLCSEKIFVGCFEVAVAPGIAIDAGLAIGASRATGEAIGRTLERTTTV